MKLRFCIAVLIVLLTGCAPATVVPTPTPSPTPEPSATPSATPLPIPTPSPTPGMEEGEPLVELPNGKKFVAHIRGHGPTVILFANMNTGSESQWSRLIDALDQEKYTLVTFAYLPPIASNVNAQGKAMLKFIRASGLNHVICIGASIGTEACGALTDEPEIIGMAMLAGPFAGSLRDNEYPKLFITGEDDPFAANMLRHQERAADPKTLITYPTAIHAADLFVSQYGADLIEKLLAFIEESVAAAG